MKIAVLGNGTVGSGVIEQANKQPNLEVSYIYVRHDLDDSKKTNDFEKIVNDDSVNLVVEAMGGLEPARTMILDAMKHHKHVVTANKAVVARYMEEFQKTATENNVAFQFEASVGGGIPWLHNLLRTMRNNKITGIVGILNGTSNFILDQMHRTKRPFDEVLKQAQDLGYAEADPTADIDGYDIENKICISADLAYHTIIKPDLQSYRWGIRTMKAQDIDYFEKNNWVVKLVGQAVRKADGLNIVIEPRLYPSDAIFSTIHDNLNYVQLFGNQLGMVGLAGQGAGKNPTADAILEDILDVLDGHQSSVGALNKKYPLNREWAKSDYVVRTTVDLTKDDRLTVVTDGNYYQVKSIEVNEMHQLMEKIWNEDKAAMAARITN